ncbi:MAG: von Willebrand factor type A domain-containing protein [Bacteroidales bacterium]
MKSLSALIIGLLFSLSGFSQAEINGSVKNKNNKPLENAVVHLYRQSSPVDSVKTDSKGHFRFKNLKPGSYQAFASKKGYRKSIPQSLILGSSSKISLSFVLKPVSQVVEELNVVDDEKEESDISINCEMDIFRSEKSSRPIHSGNKSMSGGYAQMAYESRPVQHNTESYDFIDENVFKAVVDDPLSTFSIDVDRASYANVRRFIRNNQMPPEDAVRIEEMINYFDYDYPQPENGHPFSVNTELGKCPWNKEHDLLMVGLKGEEMASEAVPASNIVFLIDVSGSMNYHNKLPLLKKSFNILIDKLRPEDKVAMVVYSGSSGLVLESTPGSQKDKIRAALNRLEAGGSTAGGAGIKLAYKVAKENYIPNGNNRVILATDGDFNVGPSSNAEMERLIESKRDDGIFLTVLGFGMGNYKDSKMERLSNKGNGNYAYIDNILEARKMFGEEIWGSLYTIAKDVKIQIEFNPAQVKAYRLIGYENRLLNKEDFNDDKKDAGEIGAGHAVTALYEIIPAGTTEKINDVDELIYQKRKTKNSTDLMTLKLRYKAPDENSSRLISQAIKRSDILSDSNSENFNLAASIAMFGMLMRESEFIGEGDYEQALELARNAKGRDTHGYRQEYIGLMENAALLK